MIGIVCAQFNEMITGPLLDSAISELKKADEDYRVISVPGAVEIPVTIKRFLKHNQAEVVIALGCVIKGETDHYEQVLKSCTEGLTRLSLNQEIPIIQGVIASPNFSLAHERREMGKEYAQTALNMKKIMHEIKGVEGQ